MNIKYIERNSKGTAKYGPKRNRSERQPQVKINYFGAEKELIFKHADLEKVRKADSVIVVVRKGGLGFDVLESYEVLDAI